MGVAERIEQAAGLRPDYYVNNLAEVDFSLLAETPFWLLDLDNTILPKDGQVVPYLFVDNLANARKMGWVRGIWVISNVGLPMTSLIERVRCAADEIGADGCTCACIGRLKPNPWAYLQGMKGMGSRPENTGIIGDQLLTDILGGKRLRLRTTILTVPSGRDGLVTKLRRVREQRMLKLLGLVPKSMFDCTG